MFQRALQGVAIGNAAAAAVAVEAVSIEKNAFVPAVDLSLIPTVPIDQSGFRVGGVSRDGTMCWIGGQLTSPFTVATQSVPRKLKPAPSEDANANNNTAASSVSSLVSAARSAAGEVASGDTPATASAALAAAAGATLRLFETGNGGVTPTSDMRLRATINLTAPDSSAPNWILAAEEISLRSAPYLAVSVRDGSSSKCYLHFVPLRPSFFSLAPVTVSSTSASSSLSAAVPSTLAALAASYFSPLVPMTLPTPITAITSFLKKSSGLMSPDFKYSHKRLPDLAASADASSAASAVESSVLVLGTVTGRILVLDMSGDAGPRWYNEPKDKPQAQAQVTSLSMLGASGSAFAVGTSDGHFQIRSSSDNTLLASSINLSFNKVAVSAFSYHAASRADQTSYLWVCRGSVPTISRSGPPQLNGRAPFAALYAVETTNKEKWAVASTDVEIDMRSKSHGSGGSDAEWIYSASNLDAHSSLRGDGRWITAFAKNSISTENAAPELWTVELQAPSATTRSASIASSSKTRWAGGEPIRTVYSLKGGPGSQHIVAIQLPIASIVDASHLMIPRSSTASSSAGARARSFSFLVEALCEFGVQRFSFSSAPNAVLDTFTKHAAHCLVDARLPATFGACAAAELVPPLSAASADSKAAPQQQLTEARASLLDMCLRLSQSACIAHFVSEMVQEKNSDTPQLLLANPEPVVAWFASVLKRDQSVIVQQQTAYNTWIRSKPLLTSNAPALDTSGWSTVLDHLHGLIRIGETLLAVRRFPTTAVDAMLVHAVLLRKQLELKLWLVKRGLAPIAEEMLTAQFASAYAARRDTKRKNANRALAFNFEADANGAGADSTNELFVDSMLSVLNVQSLLPVYPPKQLDSVLQIVLDHPSTTNAATGESVPPAVGDVKDQLSKKCLFLYYFVLDIQAYATRTQANPNRFKSIAVDFARAFGINLQYQRVLRGLWLLDSIEPATAVRSGTAGVAAPPPSASGSNSGMNDLDEKHRAGANEKKSAAAPSAATPAVDNEMSVRLTDAIECFTECADVVRAEWGGRILRTLYLQSYFKETLVFVRTVQPALSTSGDHILVSLAYLWNGLYQPAMLYQRTCCAKNNQLLVQLLPEFFHWFEAHGRMAALLQLPLNSLEDKHFIYYLKFLAARPSATPASTVAGAAPVPTCYDYLVLYLLQRNRIVEAVRYYEQFFESGGVRLPAAVIREYRAVLPAQQFDSSKLDPRFATTEFELAMHAEMNAIQSARAAAAQSRSGTATAKAKTAASSAVTQPASPLIQPQLGFNAGVAPAAAAGGLSTLLFAAGVMGASGPTVGDSKVDKNVARRAGSAMADDDSSMDDAKTVVLQHFDSNATRSVGKDGDAVAPAPAAVTVTVAATALDRRAESKSRTRSKGGLEAASPPPAASGVAPETKNTNARSVSAAAAAAVAATPIFIPRATAGPITPATPSPTKEPSLFLPPAEEPSPAAPEPARVPTSFSSSLPEAGFWTAGTGAAAVAGKPPAASAVDSTAAVAAPLVPGVLSFDSAAVLSPLVPRVMTRGPLAGVLSEKPPAPAAASMHDGETAPAPTRSAESERERERRVKERLADAIRLAHAAHSPPGAAAAASESGTAPSMFSDVKALMAVDDSPAIVPEVSSTDRVPPLFGTATAATSIPAATPANAVPSASSIIALSQTIGAGRRSTSALSGSTVVPASRTRSKAGSSSATPIPASRPRRAAASASSASRQRPIMPVVPASRAAAAAAVQPASSRPRRGKAAAAAAAAMDDESANSSAVEETDDGGDAEEEEEDDATPAAAPAQAAVADDADAAAGDESDGDADASQAMDDEPAPAPASTRRTGRAKATPATARRAPRRTAAAAAAAATSDDGGDESAGGATEEEDASAAGAGEQTPAASKSSRKARLTRSAVKKLSDTSSGSEAVAATAAARVLRTRSQAKPTPASTRRTKK